MSTLFYTHHRIQIALKIRLDIHRTERFHVALDPRDLAIKDRTQRDHDRANEQKGKM